MTTVQTSHDAYEALRAEQGNESFIFQAPTSTAFYDRSLAEAKDRAKAGRDFSVALNNLLLQTGDALQGAGAFVAALNNAGQLCAQADIQSFIKGS